MKKQLFFALTFAVLAQAEAQKLYVNVYGGYSLPTTKEAFASPNFTQTQYATGTTAILKTSDELVATTLGGGTQFGGAIGYQITDHLAVELGAHYLKGTTQAAHGDVIIDFGDSLPTRQGHADVDIRRQTQQIRLAPALVIRGGGMFKIMYPYARLGLIVPVGGKTISEVSKHFTYPDTVLMNPLLHYTNDSTVYAQYQTKGQLNLGFQSALGVEFKLGVVGIFAEIAHQSLSVRADKTDLIKYTRYGKDAMDLLTEYDKHTEYLDKITSKNNNAAYNLNGTIDATKPKQDLRVVGQYSNIGLNIGVQVRF